MKLIMENWKRFLKEGVSEDIAAVIEYAVQKGLRRDMRPEEAAQIFADIAGENTYAKEDVEAAEEDWERYDLGEVDPDEYKGAL